MLVVLACLVIQAISATAFASAAPTKHAHSTARGPLATAARILPPALNATAKRSRHADRVLVARAKGVKRCLRANVKHPGRCRSARRALQRAGTRLANVERNLARIASSGGRSTATAKASSVSAAQVAPTLTVSGFKLSWNKPDGINTFVYVIKIPGQTDRYGMISGTSATPPAVPGFTVKYSIRTSANGSLWATEKSITYPAAKAPAKAPEEVKAPPVKAPEEVKTPVIPPEEVKTPPVKAPEEVKAPIGVNTKAAPELIVSGQKLVWNAVTGVSTYVLATIVPGSATTYSEVSATSITPAAVPGVTVKYSIRTAVEGALWAPEVAISYPATPVAPTPPTPPVSTETTSNGFDLGENSGSALLYELPVLEQIGAHTARVEFGINTPVSELAPVLEAFVKAGIRPLLLAGFSGRIPSTAEAQNLGNWAAAFGPGGTFWQGKSVPASAEPTDIEFGNETNDSYQFPETNGVSGWYDSPSYVARAQNYALRFASAATAIHAVNPGVGLLAQGGDGGCGCTTWVNNMFAAVPNLGSMVAGWTEHPYGPESVWKPAISRLLSQTSAAGAPSSIPVYVTEWGLQSDNGRCLKANSGFNTCMSYSEAATALQSNVAAMHATYGSRLRAIYLFQARDQKATGTATEGEPYFGAVQSNDAAKGAFTTMVESLLAANP